jgi:hypothetical protein
LNEREEEIDGDRESKGKVERDVLIQNTLCHLSRSHKVDFPSGKKGRERLLYFRDLCDKIGKLWNGR